MRSKHVLVPHAPVWPGTARGRALSVSKGKRGIFSHPAKGLFGSGDPGLRHRDMETGRRFFLYFFGPIENSQFSKNPYLRQKTFFLMRFFLFVMIFDVDSDSQIKKEGKGGRGRGVEKKGRE